MFSRILFNGFIFFFPTKPFRSILSVLPGLTPHMLHKQWQSETDCSRKCFLYDVYSTLCFADISTTFIQLHSKWSCYANGPGLLWPWTHNEWIIRPISYYWVCNHPLVHCFSAAPTWWHMGMLYLFLFFFVILTQKSLLPFFATSFVVWIAVGSKVIYSIWVIFLHIASLR